MFVNPSRYSYGDDPTIIELQPSHVYGAAEVLKKFKSSSDKPSHLAWYHCLHASQCMPVVQFWRHQPHGQNADLFDTVILRFFGSIIPDETIKDSFKATEFMVMDKRKNPVYISKGVEAV